VLQSNNGEIEMCHAMSSFCTVILYIDVYVVWTIYCDSAATVVVILYVDVYIVWTIYCDLAATVVVCF
jgi:hypothetical protein